MSLHSASRRSLPSRARGRLVGFFGVLFATFIAYLALSAYLASHRRAGARQKEEAPTRIAPSVTKVSASGSAPSRAPSCAAESSSPAISSCAAGMAGQHVASFAWQLQQQVSEHNAASNAAGFFTCPISLYIALGLAMGGAGERKAGTEAPYVIPLQFCTAWILPQSAVSG